MIPPDTLVHARYRVLQLVGSGGMGTVYRAQDERLDKIVALKHMRVNSNPAYTRAFKREARLLAQLEHPALPYVSDSFVEDGQHFLVMEFVDGIDLGRRLATQRGPFDVAAVLQWADVLLDALKYMHTQEPRVIHYDIKPHNLKLTERGHIMLLDFGLASNQLDTLSDASRSLVGYTLDYAPLEQIHAQSPDPRSDLYALAVTLYQLLTGTLPPNAPTRASLLLDGRPDPLQPLTVLNPRVPPAVDTLVRHALSIRAADRPPDAATMRQELRAAVSGARPGMRGGGRHERVNHFALTAAHSTEHAPAREHTIPLDARSEPPPPEKHLRRAHWLARLLRRAPLVELSMLTALLLFLITIRLVEPLRGLAWLPLAGVALYLSVVALRVLLADWQLRFVAGQTLGAHGDMVLHATCAPDNTLAASASRDGTVRLWDVRSGRQLHTFEARAGAVRRLCFTADSRLLAAGCDAGIVRVWRTNDGRLDATLTGHSGSITSLAVAPDGTLASASEDQTVRLWHTDDGTLLRPLAGHRSAVWSVAFASDGRCLASGDESGGVRLWRTDDGATLQVLNAHNGGVCALAFSPDGSLLATCSEDATVRLWRVADGKEIHTLRGHTGIVRGVAFCPSGALLAARAEDTTVRLWRVADGKLHQTLRSHSGPVSGMAFAPDGSWLATASWDATVKLWRTRDGTLRATLKAHTARIWALAATADGRFLLTGGMDCTVRRWTIPR